jgi:hypothetical protein
MVAPHVDESANVHKRHSPTFPILQHESCNLFSESDPVAELRHSGSLQLHGEATGQEKEIVIDTWWWREQLQRGIDGSDCSDDGLEAGLAVYEDLPGPWPTVTGGFQVPPSFT